MPICECGCGGEAVNGQFLPGHDQKLRSKIEGMAGGLLYLRNLVEIAHQYSNDEISLHQYGDKTKRLMTE